MFAFDKVSIRLTFSAYKTIGAVFYIEQVLEILAEAFYCTEVLEEHIHRVGKEECYKTSELKKSGL